MADAKRLGIEIAPSVGLADAAKLASELEMLNRKRPAPRLKWIDRAPQPPELFRLAYLASQLTITTLCARVLPVNMDEVHSAFRVLTEDAKQKFGDEFTSRFAEELSARKRELKQEGLERVCVEQSTTFKEAGVPGVYAQ